MIVSRYYENDEHAVDIAVVPGQCGTERSVQPTDKKKSAPKKVR